MKDKLTNTDISLKLFVVLTRAAKAVQEQAQQQVQASGLGLTDFAILEALLNKGQLPISLVASKVLITNGSMTSAVDRLEAKGLVERLNHETDRRTKLINLTKKGRALIIPIFADHSKTIAAATEGLTENEKLKFIKLAKKLGKYAAKENSQS
jgi:MarR family 2-MHQ and catechol resistance regulon transcriptional repressor